MTMNESKVPTETPDTLRVKLLEGWLSFLLSVLFYPLRLAVRGYALMRLWGWFAVPTLHVPMLTIAQAAGIGLLAFLDAHAADA